MAPGDLLSPVVLGNDYRLRLNYFSIGNSTETSQPFGPRLNLDVKLQVPPIYFYDQSYLVIAQGGQVKSPPKPPVISCISLTWELPNTSSDFGQYVNKHITDYRKMLAQKALTFPASYSELWQIIQSKKTDGYKELYAKLQALIDRANKENKPLIILVGDYHHSRVLSDVFGEGAYVKVGVKMEFVPGFLASLNGITDVALEKIPSNPKQEVKITEKLRKKLYRLFRQLKELRYKNTEERDKKIWGLINKDLDLKRFFNGDLDNIVAKYFQASGRREQKFYWEIIRIFAMIYIEDDNVEDGHLKMIMYAKKKGIMVSGVNITGKDMDENDYSKYNSFCYDKYLKMLDIHMANNLERVICNARKRGKNPIVFAFAGRYHIGKDNIPLYIRTKDAIVASVFLDGGVENQCEPIDMLFKEKGLGDSIFSVDLNGYRKADYIFHLPSNEGSVRYNCLSPIIIK